MPKCYILQEVRQEQERRGIQLKLQIMSGKVYFLFPCRNPDRKKLQP